MAIIAKYSTIYNYLLKWKEKMKLELKEHELERVIEVYLQLQFNKEVHVNGFDLSGMRSKDGLSAMVDFTLVGESDAREPKTESTNVFPTNTSWRESTEPKEQKEVRPDLSEQDTADWQKFLELITDNAMYKNYDAIYDLLNNASDVIKTKIESHPLFVEMAEEVDKTLQTIVENTLGNSDSILDEVTTEGVEEVKEIEETPEPEIEHAEALKEELSVEPEEPEEKPKASKNLFGSSIKPSRKLFS